MGQALQRGERTSGIEKDPTVPTQDIFLHHLASNVYLRLWEELFLLSATDGNQTEGCQECCAHLRQL